jgi:GDP-L-fucose synthase
LPEIQNFESADVMAKHVSKYDRIFVCGHRGLVGSAIVRSLRSRGHESLLLRTRAELDLRKQDAVEAFFTEQKPDVVFLAAAKVGGILANNELRADFILENLKIQSNVLDAALRSGVRRLVFLGSSCIYPRLAPQPIREESLLTGPLEFTNRPYAVAKIAGLESVTAIRAQHGRDFFSVMPTNLYGPFDNFDPSASHVLPALVRKFVEAVEAGSDTVTLWGSGEPRREFLFSDDCADAIVHLAESLTPDYFESKGYMARGLSHINIGTGEDVTISELADVIAKAVGFRGRLEFDRTKPDGTPRKLLDVSVLRSTGWSPCTSLESGITQTLDWFSANKE